MSIYESVPFPAVAQEPTELAKKLQERIRYMFGITVEPVIVRHPGSYYKTAEFRILWTMATACGRYEIASFEPAAVMAEKGAWHVFDMLSLDNYPGPERVTGKTIY